MEILHSHTLTSSANTAWRNTSVKHWQRFSPPDGHPLCSASESGKGWHSRALIELMLFLCVCVRCVCIGMCVCDCFHARTQALYDWGLKNAFTVWSNSQACRQIHMSEQTPWAFHVKVNVNRLRLSSSARLPQQSSCSTPRPSFGQGGALDLLWIGGGLETLSEGWRRAECPVWLGSSLPPPPPHLPPPPPPLPLQSLVVHQRLDFVHKLASYLQDVLDVMTLGHLCGSDTLSEKQLQKYTYTIQLTHHVYSCSPVLDCWPIKRHLMHADAWLTWPTRGWFEVKGAVCLLLFNGCIFRK